MSMSKAEEREWEALKDEYKRLTGTQEPLYSSHPGEGEAARYVFTDKVCLGFKEAIAHLKVLIARQR